MENCHCHDNSAKKKDEKKYSLVKHVDNFNMQMKLSHRGQHHSSTWRWQHTGLASNVDTAGWALHKGRALYSTN